MKKPLYFIAILPDAGIRAEVTRFKNYAAEHFKSSHALRSPPHITLFPPFLWAPEEKNRLVDNLRLFAQGERPFPVMLNNFNCFAPRVIFIDIQENTVLQGIQSRLEKQLKTTIGLSNPSRRDFHPHMTIAFKDLRRSIFPKAWEYFSGLTYKRLFSADALSLLQHNGKIWTVYQEFSLSK